VNKATVTAALVSLAALLAGCGGNTKADFVARADAICAKTVRETRSLAPPGVSQDKRQQLHALAVYLAVVLPLVESESAQIRALKRPTGDARGRAALARYLAALAQAATDYGQLAAAAKRGDAQGVASAEAALGANPVSSLATGYGLRSCGSPGATVA
jgi:hypothetical protein